MLSFIGLVSLVKMSKIGALYQNKVKKKMENSMKI